jgi:hypothetical protein
MNWVIRVEKWNPKAMIDPKLRHELTRLTQPPDDAGLEWLEVQVREIASLNEKCPHSVRLHQRCPDSRDERNCFMLALGIEPDAVREWCLGSIFVGKQFVNFLVEEGILQRLSGDPSLVADGDVVVYFGADGPNHAGRWFAGEVISKWGAGQTHIWRHPLLEVPGDYGDEVQFFAPLSNAVSIYCEWAASHGL